MNLTKALLIALFLGLPLLVGKPGWSNEMSLQKAEDLIQEATRLRQQGQYTEAIPLTERILAIREKVLGIDHPEVAQSLVDMAVLYRKSGREKKAEEIEKRTVAIRAIK